MKVLLFCPLHPGRDDRNNPLPQLFGRTNMSIFRQTVPVLDMWFSKGDNPYFDNNGRNNIKHNYNKARRFVLDNRYDALFTVESDMIIPPDALEKLMQVDADVAYGLYCFRHTNTWSAFTQLDPGGGKSLTKDKARAREVWGKTLEVAGVGLGCTLIHRNVLEQIEFRVDESMPSLHNDWLFAVDLQAKGFKQVCDTSVVCGHISTMPVPRTIWPDPNEPRMFKNEFLERVPVREDGTIGFEITGFGEFAIPREAIQEWRTPQPKQ